MKNYKYNRNNYDRFRPNEIGPEGILFYVFTSIICFFLAMFFTTMIGVGLFLLPKIFILVLPSLVAIFPWTSFLLFRWNYYMELIISGYYFDERKRR